MKHVTLTSLALLCTWGSTTSTPNAGVINVLHHHKSEENGLEIDITPANGPLTHGLLGLSLPSSIGSWTQCDSSTDYLCAHWGDFATVRLKPGRNPTRCTRVEWTSPFARELQDCFDINPSVHWYGGGEVYSQHWPIETQTYKDSAFLTGTGDLFGVIENYWLMSSGAFIVVDPDVPLYHSLNTTHVNRVCFTSKDQTPYNKQSPLTFSYEVCTGTDVKDAHQLAMTTFFDKPRGMPDTDMMIKPFWSTWAEYKTDVNESVVVDLARRVVSEGFSASSHVEIDDNWEGCYGDIEFDSVKFPDPKRMVDEVKGLGMRVTVWVHPFVNYGCKMFDEGFRNGYFVQTPRGKTAITDWWEGSNSGAIDVTNPDAVKWWTDRLRNLQSTTGVDSFKFDAGEVTYLPSSISLNNSTRGWPNPNVYTTAYVDAVSEFGGLIETRAGHLNQNAPVFVRMLDKSSSWGYGNGLRSLIPTLLLFGVLGYPFVLPDMIGGNAYGERPGKEMYVRWMEANVFMPGVQFSLVPWGYDEETVKICLKVLELREMYSDVLIDAARMAVEDGSPVNRPIWWVAPNDTVTFTIDDEYMLGDTILVAPVVDEGVVSRDIYLPEGTWRSGVDSSEYVGPTWVLAYPAPLDVVPFFVKVG